MRTYIFTKRERGVVQSFLAGKTQMSARELSKIRSRTKLFDRLKDDVFLYLELWDRMLLSNTEPEAAVST
jgi:hypothetical protein